MGGGQKINKEIIEIIFHKQGYFICELQVLDILYGCFLHSTMERDAT
jgi:hypothetical protein